MHWTTPSSRWDRARLPYIKYIQECWLCLLQLDRGAMCVGFKGVTTSIRLPQVIEAPATATLSTPTQPHKVLKPFASKAVHCYPASCSLARHIA
jgi:hypothetical protein